MLSYQTHLTILERTARRCPDNVAFRVPEVDESSSDIRHWQSITYKQFLQDVERSARYWLWKLTADDISAGSVIGLWLGGTTYVDVLHIYGIARAGFIPQLISLRLPNAEVILELLNLSKGKAIVHDASFTSPLRRCPLPVYAAVDVREASPVAIDLPPVVEGSDADDIIMLFHTSGSTSGRPKLVPCTYAWWSTTIMKAGQIMRPKTRSTSRQDTAVCMGSLCHMGQSFMLAGALEHGSCTVLYTKQAYSSDELLDMMHRCGLTRMNIFPTFLSVHLKNSRRDPRLLAGLQALDEILVTGLPMSPEDQQWVRSNGINVLDCYASTEVAVMMLSTGQAINGRLPPLQPIEGASYAMVATAPQPPQSDSGYYNLHARLLELVVLAHSPDCPHPSLRDIDGNYHTGDLFFEQSPGKYVYYGRDDDWIKTEVSLRCNTKAIEENVYTTCGDLVSNCVVVGTGRPSPALIVESLTADVDAQKLKAMIYRRIRAFHARRYLHERIASADAILVAPANTLPRTATKGNIRRRAAEEDFKAELDRIYSLTR
ncbi:acetyl-CoA synthetase-like protein [Laetiporus sulphureus 93-53]|uniref:Acetyl-CoA synthetase-like protein n=1 Tax=Laetiporus sulphureus 93-53 TaxID=1314785 RepID=A0A165DYR7_9APHY|nr:acetyl-CoA synthetase-like protein [Laetiporus sulphureus 93-53]KZT05903.1 acetyl-CoA synthetase-like protein [Laetiporus sulphureus 93-53]